ncbi:MAG: PepSY-associated TM helix domain-containing protein [Bacteroidota bacterium]
MKKLKGLGNRTYNALFHTHTVAGIVISFGLFVIFYAGAYALFRHEIIQWENPDMRQEVNADLDLDAALAKVDGVYELDYSQNTNLRLPTEESPVFTVYGAQRKADSTIERMAAYVSPDDMHIQDLNEPKTTVGDTIYVLHYFGQIPVPRLGLFLSGFVALFFLFAIVSGVMIHWRNLLTKFYAFVKEGKWKTIWTNAHTVLGVIGLPFQLAYAVTGAFFGLLTLVLLPTVFLMYDGDTEKVFEKVNPASALTIDEHAPAYEHLSLNVLAAQIKEAYPGFHVNRVSVRNYGKEDALAFWNIDDHKGIFSSGNLAMRMKDGVVLEEYSLIPNKRSYSYGVVDFITKLHFATFGGGLLKILYFVLAMITCFMIISGVLIWRTARDNPRYTFKQRLFHHRVTKWYLAICLSMFPAFALIFLANKIVPMDMVGRASTVNTIFFLGWLALTLVGLAWNRYSAQNRNYLLLGGMLSLFVPVANGIATGGWVWETWQTSPSVAYIDLFWFFSGITALVLVFFVLKVKPDSDKPQEGQIEEASAPTNAPVRKKLPHKPKPAMVKYSRLRGNTSS